MTRSTSTLILGIAMTITFARPASPQNVSELRKLYDAGKYQQVADTTVGAPATDPRATYLVARSQEKLARKDEARRAYQQLAAHSDQDPWSDIGRSAVALLGSNAQGALDAANQAVAHGEALPEAHFQRGLALNARRDMAEAAAAFDRAAQLDPAFAYAHYYAGIAYSKVKRVDLMAQHFDMFLKLAPQAPERPEVQSIMRTLGGRD
jgi:tetratricopeptide (TPR) repeat protein